MSKTLAIVLAACVSGATSPAAAASRHAGPAAHRDANHQRLAHTRVRTPDDRFNFRAHGFRPSAYPYQPYSPAQERWFDKAKGNIWGD
jgi:hypothetical protein